MTGHDGATDPRRVELEPDATIWERVFTTAPLVLVGTKDDGTYDLAPKHLAMPVGFSRMFCFACTPRHRTYTNVQRHGAFTVSYPRPSQVVTIGQAAAPREDSGEKPSLLALPVVDATKVDGVLVADAYLHLECELDHVDGDLDGYGLVVGRVVAASAADDAVRISDLDDADLLERAPALAFLSPARFATVAESRSFPFPRGFER